MDREDTRITGGVITDTCYCGSNFMYNYMNARQGRKAHKDFLRAHDGCRLMWQAIQGKEHGMKVHYKKVF